MAIVKHARSKQPQTRPPFPRALLPAGGRGRDGALRGPAGNQHVGGTSGVCPGNGSAAASRQKRMTQSVWRRWRPLLSGAHPPAQRETRTLGLQFQGRCHPHCCHCCVHVGPSGCLAFQERRHGVLFLKVALRMGCSVPLLQGCSEVIRGRAQC